MWKALHKLKLQQIESWCLMKVGGATDWILNVSLVLCWVVIPIFLLHAEYFYFQLLPAL